MATENGFFLEREILFPHFNKLFHSLDGALNQLALLSAWKRKTNNNNFAVAQWHGLGFFPLESLVKVALNIAKPLIFYYNPDQHGPPATRIIATMCPSNMSQNIKKSNRRKLYPTVNGTNLHSCRNTETSTRISEEEQQAGVEYNP